MQHVLMQMLWLLDTAHHKFRCFFGLNGASASEVPNLELQI